MKLPFKGEKLSLENREFPTQLSPVFLWTAVKLSIGLFLLISLASLAFASAIILPGIPKKQLQTNPIADKAVLGTSTEKVLGKISFNIPSYFTDTATFQQGTTFNGKAVFNNDIQITNHDLDLGTGKLTASNVVYGVTAGPGITVSGGQKPTVSNTGVLSVQGQTGAVAFTPGTGITFDGLKINNTGVTSVQGQTGAVTLTAGSGISIDGTTISNTSQGSNAFGTITSGNTTISANSPNATITFAAGNGITVTPDATNKVLTFAATAAPSNLTTNGLLYATSTTAYSSLDTGTSGYVLESNGASSPPSWVAATNIATGFGTITTGTNSIATMTIAPGASLTYQGGTVTSGVINANQLLGGTWAIPGAIGATTPNTGSFTTLTATTVNGVNIINNGSNTLNIAAGKSFIVNNTLTLSGTDSTSFTLPSASDTLVGRTSTDTLTNKTIAAGSNTISGLTNANLSGTAGITNANLANSSVTVTAGTGLSGGGAVALGSSVTINNDGVLSLTSTQATVSASTGNITISLPQNIDTDSSPYFKNLTLSGLGAGVIHSNSSGLLSSSAVSLTGDVSGTLSLANGGTNANLTADNGGIVYSTGTTLAILAHSASANQCLLSGGTGAPSWGSCALGTNYWALNSGFLSPTNGGNSIVVGQTTGLANSGIDVDTNSQGNSVAVFNQQGNGDIFTASASGTPRLVLSNNGNLNIIGGSYQIGGIAVLSSSALGTGVTGSSLTSLGTISTGTWQATAIGAQYGGTGIDTHLSTGVPSISSGTWSVSAQLPLSFGGTNANLTADNGGIVYSTGTALAILTHTASTNQCLLSGGAGAPSWGTCALGNNYWQQNTDSGSGLGVLSPATIANTLAIGITNPLDFSGLEVDQNSKGNASAVINQTGSGDIFTASSAGTPQFVITNNGHVGIGATSPLNVRLQVGASGTVMNPTAIYEAEYSNSKGTAEFIGNWASAGIWGIGPMSGNADNTVRIGTLTSSANTAWNTTQTTNLVLGGGIGLGGATSLLGTIDARATTGTTPIATFSGSTSFAGLLVDNSGNGDLFTASSSGLPRFTITQTGNITDTTATSVNFSGANLTVASCTGCAGGTSWSSFTNNGNTIINPTPVTDALSIGNAGTGNYLPFSSFYVEPAFSSKGNALIGLNQTGSGPIFTASQAGITKFVIDNAGNVGIGTTTPKAALDIVGSASTSGNLTFRGGGTQQINLENNSSLAFYTSVGGDVGIGATSPNLFICSAGSGCSGNGMVGINTNNPQVQLDVSGNVRARDGGGLQVADTVSGNYVASLKYDSSVFGLSNITRIRLGGLSGPSGFGISNFDTTMLMYIQNNGHIGIDGNTTPTAWLDIGSTSSPSNTGLHVGVNSLGNATLAVDNTGGAGDLFTASSAGSPKFVINSSGNVGIGTTLPTQALQIAGGNVLLDNGQFYEFKDNAGAVRGVLTLTSANNLQLRNGASSGNIQITNNSTAGRTQIGDNGIGSTNLSVYENGTNPAASVSANTSFAGLVVDNSGVGDIFTASSSGLNRFVITQSGNVGIGITNPANLLQVNGTLGLQNSQTISGVTNYTQFSNGIAVGGATTFNITNAGVGTFASATSLTSNGPTYFQVGSTAGSGSFGRMYADLVRNGDFALTDGSANSYLYTYAGSATGSIPIGSTGIGLNVTSPHATLDVEGGNTGGNAGLIVNQTGANINDIFTASAGGTTKFTIGYNGNITDTAAPTINFSNAALTVSSCTGCGSGTNYWQRVVDSSSGFNVLSPATIADTFSLGVTGAGTNLVPYSGLYVESNSFNTKGNALVALNQSGNGPILTASSSGTTAFVIDNAGNVGIGKSLPAATLDIQGITPSSGNSEDVLDVIGGNGASPGFGNGGNAGGISLTAGNGGNPSSGFSGGAGGSITFTAGNGANSSSNAGSGGSISIVAGSGGSGASAGGNGGNLYLVGGAAGVGTAGNVFLGITSGGSVRGLVGIGTLSPLATLDLRADSGTLPIASISGKTSFAGLVVDNSGKGDLFSASSSGLTRFTISQTGNLTDTTYAGANAILYAVPTTGLFSTAITTTGSQCLISGAGSSGTPSWGSCSAGSNFWQRNTSGGITYISPATISDQLSIGLTAPTLPNAGLYVESNNFNTKGNALIGFNQTGNGPIMTASVSGTTKFVIDNSGNVGIGKSTPTAALDIVGANAVGAAPNALTILGGNSTGNSNGTGGGISITGGTGGFGNLSTNAGNGGDITLTAGTGGAGVQDLQDGSGGNIHILGGTGGNDNGSGNGGNVYIAGGTAGSGTAGNVLLAENSGTAQGNVGIATTNPTAALQIGTDATQIASPHLLYIGESSSNSSGLAQIIGNWNNSTDWAIGTASNTSGDTTLRIGAANGNNSGSWMSTQNLSLLIDGAPGTTALKNTGIDVETNSLGNAATVINNVGGAGDILTASSGGATKFVINSSGNIGIGTTTPLEKLDVEGGNLEIGQQTNTGQSAEQNWTDQNAGCPGSCVAGKLQTTTAIASISAMAVYNGSLYVGTTKYSNGSGGAEVYRYNGSAGNWTSIVAAAGTIKSGGTTNIGTISAMTVYNGYLYVGTTRTATAEVYRYDGGSNWTVINTVGGQFDSGSVTGQDGITSMAVVGGRLFVGSSKTGNARVFRYNGGTGSSVFTSQGNFTASFGDNVDTVTAMASFNGELWAATKLGDGQAQLQVFTDGTSWHTVNGNTSNGSCATEARGRFCINGSGGAVTGITAITSMVVYDNKLYLGMRKLGAGDLMYFEPVYGSSAGQPNDDFVRAINAAGTVVSGGTTIDSISALAVYNGRLYAGTEALNKAEIYRYEGATTWTKISQATAGTIASGGTANIDMISALLSYNGNLYSGTFDTGGASAEVYNYNVVSDQSYALKFHAGLTEAGGEQNSLLNIGSISFIASNSANTNTDSNNTGSFVFSNGIMTNMGAYDYAEDYGTRDDTLAPGDIVALDSNENQMVVKADNKINTAMVGIYSTNPGFDLSQKDATINGGRAIPIALNGRVPVKVTTENGAIKNGDLLTISSTPGVAMKATKPGMMIARAMEAYDGDGVGTVMAFVTNTWADPGVQLTSTGDLNNADNLPQSFAAAPPITDQAVLAASTTSLSNNPNATLSGAMTDSLSQLGNEVSLLQTQYASLSAQMRKMSVTDDFSSHIAALEKQININDVIASDSAAISSSNCTNNGIASRQPARQAPDCGLVRNDESGNATISGQLSVLGKTLLSDVGITGKISMGLLTIDGMGSDATNPAAEINTLSGPLKLQALGLAGVDFEHGKVMIDTSGNMTINAEVTAKKYNVDTSDSQAASLGEAILPSGKTSVTINSTAVTDNSKIFVTSESLITQPLTVTNKVPGKSFTVEINEAQWQNVKFNWWIVN